MIKCFINLCLILFCLSTLYSQGELKFRNEMPYFTGCEHEKDERSKRDCSNRKISSYIANHIQYPEEAIANGVEGIVYVNFRIDSLGNVIYSKVIRDIGYGCGHAALDVVNSFPSFEPAISQGKPISVDLNLPVQFALSYDEQDGNNRGFSLSWGQLVSRQISRDQIINNIDEDLIARDSRGSEQQIEEIIVSYDYKRKNKVIKSRKHLNELQRKLVQKAKVGSVITFSANVQKLGNFYYVNKSFFVKD